MNRKRDGKKKIVKHSIVEKLTNKVMWDGKKSLSREKVRETFDRLKIKQPNQDPLLIFKEVVEALKLELETKKWKFGGAKRLISKKVSPERSQSLALNWLVWAARKKRIGKISENLAQEIATAWEDQKNLKETKAEFKPKSEVFKKWQTEQKKVIESINFASSFK
jgi:ribosomal protein S7